MIDNIHDLPYRPGVGMMVINNEGLVFVGKRIDTKAEAWQMPQGGVDEGEDEETAAIRELEEEIGAKITNIIATSDKHFDYDLPKDLVPKIWNGKYRGQKQRWFLFRFDGDDSEINIATKHAEFCQWKWVTIDELPEIIVPFKRDLYSKIVTEFKDLVQ